MLQPDTRKLLVTGGTIFTTGCLAAVLMFAAFGGVTRDGPHTNMGWLMLMITMGCLPTGVLTLGLAVAKVVGDRQKP